MRLRHTLLALASASLVITLAGCAAEGSGQNADSASDASCVAVSSGAQSDAVKVSGEFGGPVTAKFTAPLTTTEIERTIAESGKGESIKAGQSVSVSETFISGETGERIGAQVFELVSGDVTMPEPIRAGIDCLSVGTRSVTVFPAEMVYQPQQLVSLGLLPGQTLVLVTDIVDLVVDPVAVDWTDGVPTVTFDANGQPSIALPSNQAPEDVSVAVLTEGDGEVVAAGDSVTVSYMGVSWSDGQVFDQNYDSSPTALALTGVVKGFRAALIGQKVGSQILASIPYAYAYGDESSGHELGGQDLVFLIDIVATEPAAP